MGELERKLCVVWAERSAVEFAKRRAVSRATTSITIATTTSLPQPHLLEEVHFYHIERTARTCLVTRARIDAVHEVTANTAFYTAYDGEYG